jgi:dUTP pyrophosphatase
MYLQVDGEERSGIESVVTTSEAPDTQFQGLAPSSTALENAVLSEGGEPLPPSPARGLQLLGLSILVTPIRVKRIHPDAQLPKYAHGPEEDAGADLFAVEDYVLVPGQTYAVPTGLKIEVAPGFEAQIRSRGSMAMRGVVVANAPGTIDPAFRGEVKVLLRNLGRDGYSIRKGERIAQVVVARYSAAEYTETEDELTETERGAGALGSTGR